MDCIILHGTVPWYDTWYLVGHSPSVVTEVLLLLLVLVPLDLPLRVLLLCSCWCCYCNSSCRLLVAAGAAAAVTFVRFPLMPAAKRVSFAPQPVIASTVITNNQVLETVPLVIIDDDRKKEQRPTRGDSIDCWNPLRYCYRNHNKTYTTSTSCCTANSTMMITNESDHNQQPSPLGLSPSTLNLNDPLGNNNDDDDPLHHQYDSYQSNSYISNSFADLSREIMVSSELLFNNKLNWLLVLGPLALIGDATGTFSEAVCFTFSGIALIPCAERYAQRRMEHLPCGLASPYRFPSHSFSLIHSVSLSRSLSHS